LRVTLTPFFRARQGTSTKKSRSCGAQLRATIRFAAKSTSDSRRGARVPRAAELTSERRISTHAAPQVRERASDSPSGGAMGREDPVGSVIKKRRKKMRKHKKRKLLRRARHKRKK
jgi:hypothetical protein